MADISAEKPIIVKFLGGRSQRRQPHRWIRQFPHDQPVWGRCHFVFDPDVSRYDWLVVYEDLPKAGPDNSTKRSQELLGCPREHTLLLTTEPSSIKLYGRRFVTQFGHVLTSQESWALPHPKAVRSQPALRWFYGSGRDHNRSFDQMANNPPLDKSRLISIIASSKQQRHTLHRQRYHFAHELKSLLPELDVYGRGVRDMDDKAEALDSYRYHVAVENFIGPHHWTEKLADTFLGCCLPFYYGAPNFADYFPEDSVIPIDIFDPPGAARIIRRAIENNEHEKRLESILEARRRVLHQYGTFPVVARLIEERHSSAVFKPGEIVLSRHALRAGSLLDTVEGFFAKSKQRLRQVAGAPAVSMMEK